MAHIAPENKPGPKRKPDRIPTIHFQGRFAVRLREGNYWEGVTGREKFKDIAGSTVSTLLHDRINPRP